MKTFFKSSLTTRLDDQIAREQAEAEHWRAVCREVDARDGYRRRACDGRLVRAVSAIPNRLERHHIVPLSRGGADTTSNVLSLCLQCHQLRHVKGTLAIKGNANRKVAFTLIDAETGKTIRHWESAA